MGSRISEYGYIMLLKYPLVRGSSYTMYIILLYSVGGLICYITCQLYSAKYCICRPHCHRLLLFSSDPSKIGHLVVVVALDVPWKRLHVINSNWYFCAFYIQLTNGCMYLCVFKFQSMQLHMYMYISFFYIIHKSETTLIFRVFISYNMDSENITI